MYLIHEIIIATWELLLYVLYISTYTCVSCNMCLWYYFESKIMKRKFEEGEGEGRQSFKLAQVRPLGKQQYDQWIRRSYWNSAKPSWTKFKQSMSIVQAMISGYKWGQANSRLMLTLDPSEQFCKVRSNERVTKCLITI